LTSFSAIEIFLISAVFFLCGYLLRKRNGASEIKRLIEIRHSSHLLGQMAKDDEQKKELAQAYYDSEKAFQELDEYHWDIKDLILSPFLGYAPAPCIEKTFQINSNQFRSSENVLSPKPDNAYRIFLVGGSTAFGSGAPDQERTIGGYLKNYLDHQAPQKKKEKYEVHTVAAPAWSSSHERIAIENLVSEMEPDLVISFSGNNEAHWGWNFKNTLWFRSYADNHFWKIINAAYSSAGFDTFEDPIKDREKVLSPENLSRILKKNVDLECYALSPTGTKHYYAFQPTIPLTQKPLTQREKKILAGWHPDQVNYFRQYHKLATVKLKALEEKYEYFRFFDLSGLFDEKSKEEEIFLDSSHFGDKGYDFISKSIYNLIQSEI
jgi:hypothetical protein